MEQHITELTMLLIYLTGWEEDKRNAPGKTETLYYQWFTSYKSIFRQDFNFWQPYFKVKKPWLHRGKVLFAYSFFFNIYRPHSTLQ